MRPCDDPARRCLKFDDWPTADRSAWAIATARADGFEEDGPLGRLKPVSQEKLLEEYARWLGWLARSHADLLGLQPAERVTRDIVAAYVATLRNQVKPQSLRNLLVGLHQVIGAISPEHDWSWLRDAINRAVSSRNRRTRRGPPDDTAGLEALGRRLMSEAEGMSAPARRRIQYRDGLLVAVAAARGLRLADLAALRVGQELRREPDGWLFHLRTSKTGAVISGRMPAWLSAALDRYLAVYRVELLGQHTSDALWVNWNGTALKPRAVSQTFTRRVARHYGVTVGPHVVRDAAATTVAVHAPEAMEVVPSLLGHRHRDTMLRHYNLADGISAGYAFDAIVDAVLAARQGHDAEESSD